MPRPDHQQLVHDLLDRAVEADLEPQEMRIIVHVVVDAMFQMVDDLHRIADALEKKLAG